ncbi:IclR family transcriptional regulator [Parafrankia elaeagni]|uniref:IclR family transcriptional regulator n=1 Tax=Parafrankia elaeagni TaxID=222534 RepID=UPI000381FFA3|nr:IclR family transcriptional regulator C-terminal domain-containing protein [Parafrankia elaeagni]
MTDVPAPKPEGAPQNHRTIDRVTRILEEVVYNPGMTFVELVRALDAPKSSVHGFVRGLLAAGWVYEEGHRFYLGPALYGLTLASGGFRAGMVTDADIASLYEAAGVTVFVGVQAGDHLIYVSEFGADRLAGFAARNNIRRTMLGTAGGKAILAALPAAQRDAYLRRRKPEEAALVDQFLVEYEDIRRTRIAQNTQHAGTRSAIATVVSGQSGEPVAEVTLVGPSTEVLPRREQLAEMLLEHVDSWRRRAPLSR